MKFSSPYGFNHGEEFFQYLKDNFDCLYEEGATAPKMMSIGMHCRTLGKPSRFMALKKFLGLRSISRESLDRPPRRDLPIIG